MNKSQVITQLRAIKNRYFRPVIAYPDGYLTHHGDCEIHRAKEMYVFAPCTCGLLHDLRWLEWTLAEKIYPKFGDELMKSDMTWEQELEAKARGPIPEEEMRKFFEAAGFKFNDEPPDFEQIKREENEQWEVITHVFGEKYVQFLKGEK